MYRPLLSKGTKVLLLVLVPLLLGIAGHATQPDQPKKEPKVVAGKAEVLKVVPKKFATFLGIDAAKGVVTLHLEGEKDSSTWSMKPDAEFKVMGWWGRPDQFQQGDRVWVWFTVDRSKKPKGILMLADEISEQDIHERPCTLISDGSIKGGTITLEDAKKAQSVLKVGPQLVAGKLKIGAKVYVQSAGKKARLLLTEKDLDQARQKQKDFLAEIWRKQGLPGTVVFLHPLGGEMEIMLDHEAMRWGRYLKQGDKVNLKPVKAEPDYKPIQTVVKKVQPWREYTRLLLVSNYSFDQSDLELGQRIAALVSEPPHDVQQSPLPTDLGRLKTKEERIKWFLASVYCTCKVGGDQCTGMFYIQASCNVNSCGMPNNIANQVGKMIDKGMDDRQILEELLKTRGPSLLKPHLLP